MHGRSLSYALTPVGCIAGTAFEWPQVTNTLPVPPQAYRLPMCRELRNTFLPLFPLLWGPWCWGSRPLPRSEAHIVCTGIIHHACMSLTLSNVSMLAILDVVPHPGVTMPHLCSSTLSCAQAHSKRIISLAYSKKVHFPRHCYSRRASSFRCSSQQITEPRDEVGAGPDCVAHALVHLPGRL